MDWVINYAFLPRMSMQGQRQTIERHSASPLPSPARPRSAVLQLCLIGREAGRHIRDQVYPSSAPLSSKMPPHLAMGLSSQTNPWEQPELGAPWGRPVGIGRIEFLTSPAPVLGVLSIHPTPGLLPHHSVLQVPSPDCEGTSGRAPPAGPSSALRRPTMLGSRAPWRSRSRETATAAQVLLMFSRC